MAEVSTVLKGTLEDHLGRVLHPDSEADQILCDDGKSVETRLAELLAAFAEYLPLNGGGTVNGNLELKNGRFTASEWAGVSAGSDGFVLFGKNCYKHPINNRYYYKNTHKNIGASGIVLKYGSEGVYWFDMGTIATVKDQEFTPDIKSLTNPDAPLISGQDLNGLTQNGRYCGQNFANAPFGSKDWWYIFVQNLTQNSVNYVSQVAVAVNQQAIYSRNRRNGTWGSWERTATLIGDGNASYIQIPRYGPDSGRGGYVGFPDGNQTLYLTNDQSGGAINLSAQGGVMINGTKIPMQHISSAYPDNSQGADGDTWDVYV